MKEGEPKQMTLDQLAIEVLGPEITDAINEIEVTVEQGKENLIPQIGYYLYGGGTAYRAECLALGIRYGGNSPEQAFEGFLTVARQEINGILEGRGGPNDERVPVAEYLMQAIEKNPDVPFEEFFIRLPEAPPFRPGI